MREIGAQAFLVDLPVAVLAPVEQHHRQPVTVFRPQGVVPGGSGRIDVGGRQIEIEFVGQFREPGVHPFADPAPGAGE